MNPVDLHHRSANIIWEIALGQLDGARQRELYALAAGLEELAAYDIHTTADHAEPSRSVLHRSAACLHLRAGQPLQARAIAVRGLQSSSIPKAIADELRGVIGEADRIIAAETPTHPENPEVKK